MYKYVRLMHWLYDKNPVFIPVNLALFIIYLSITGAVFLPAAMYVLASKPYPVFLDLFHYWFNPNYKTPIAMPKYTPPAKPVVGYFKSKTENVWVKANTADTDIPYVRVDVLSDHRIYGISMPWAVAVNEMYAPCTEAEFNDKFNQAKRCLGM
jgi:hypothetical protein